MKAAGNNDCAVIHSLLAEGLDIDGPEESGRGRTALMCACRHGQTEAVLLLLQRGASVDLQDTFGDTALAYAACNGYTDIVKLLLDHGADPDIHNRAGRTVLEEIGYELLGKSDLTGEEGAEAQRLFWTILTICRDHLRQRR